MQKHSVIEVEQAIREDLAFVEGQFRVLRVNAAREDSELLDMCVGTLYGEHRALAIAPAELRGKVVIGAVIAATGWPEALERGPGLMLEVIGTLPPEEWCLHHCPTSGLPVSGAGAVHRIAALIDREIRNPAVAQGVHATMANPEVFEPFFTAAASRLAHHAEPGGLAVHSLETAEVIASLPRHIHGSEIGRDLAIVAGLIHDLGKIYRPRAGASYVCSDICHESRGMLLAKPLLDWLREHEDPSVSEHLFYLLSTDSKSEHASCVSSAVVMMADRVSATANAVAMAFATKPSHYSFSTRELGGGKKKRYLRAVERYLPPRPTRPAR